MFISLFLSGLLVIGNNYIGTILTIALGLNERKMK